MSYGEKQKIMRAFPKIFSKNDHIATAQTEDLYSFLLPAYWSQSHQTDIHA